MNLIAEEDGGNNENGMLASFFILCKAWVMKRVHKMTGIKKGVSLKGSLLFLAFSSLIVGPIIYFRASIISAFMGNRLSGITESVPKGEPISSITMPAAKKLEKKIFSEKCPLDNGVWKNWLGSGNQNTDDRTYFILPSDSRSFLYKYHGKIEDFALCDFLFTTRSTNAANYIISLDEVYQITVGDNDMRTVTFKAKNSIGGEYLPIKEARTQRTRPMLSSSIKPGTNVGIKLETNPLGGTGRYKVDVSIEYKSGQEMLETKYEDFSWVFDPSPQMAKKMELSVGLIRDEKDKSEVGANFLYPDLNYAPPSVKGE